MNYVSTHDKKGAVRLGREQVADLLSRYPHVSDHEAHQILNFLRRGPHLEVGLLTSNVGLRPKFDAFVEDHKAHFKVKWAEGAAVVGGILALLAAFWFLWEGIA